MTQQMDWQSLLCKDRRFNSPDVPDEDAARTLFQQDIDRIVFSGSFRRLGRKTQVHPLNENDHIHTRLLHSIEASSVGRSMGMQIGLFLRDRGQLPGNVLPSEIGEIVQAACLAHDLGNPPFGHAGEDAIRSWFRNPPADLKKVIQSNVNEAELCDLRCFDGNAMAFRTVVYKEFHTGTGGMRLTYPTLAALLKYPWTSQFGGPEHDDTKFSVFQSECDAFEDVAKTVGLLQSRTDKQHRRGTTLKYCRHPLAYLVEAADDICYRILDIEDAIELDMVRADDIIPKLGTDLAAVAAKMSRENYSQRSTVGRIRAKMIGHLIERTCMVFQTHYDEIMAGAYSSSLFNDRSVEEFENLRDAYGVIEREVFTSRRKGLIEISSYAVLGDLLNVIVVALDEIAGTSPLSYKSKHIQQLLKMRGQEELLTAERYTAIMTALDYITGMTDQYAREIWGQMSGIGPWPKNVP